MRRFLTLTAVVMLAAAWAGAQTLSGSVEGGRLVRGRAARVTITLDIPPGLHVNSRRPGSVYAIRTRVRISATRGIRLSPVTYPGGRLRKFPFAARPLSIYEGRVRFTTRATVPASFRGRRANIAVSVTFQPCTDEVCYLPRTRRINLSAAVTGAP